MRDLRIKTTTFLANLPMFQQLAPDDLERIARGTTELRLPKGKVVFQRGDPCVGFHALVYGQVKLGFVSPQGAEKVVEIIHPGQSFGEALMFTDRPYVVFAQCLADSLMLHIDKATIDAEIERDPRLARRMIAGLSMRLHGLIQDVEAYSLRSGMQRVIGYLLRDIDEHADPTAPLRIQLATQKGVIASRLNLTPEHFSRVLSELAQEGLIEVHGSEIQILDPVRIRGFLT
ncbi:MAG: Crp/Fnr family transcriptional regulator [Burkholderiaceae bacterium]|nr:Crp/Fnr family transcriptional regulator [Burkholderiaceae bacterium]